MEPQAFYGASNLTSNPFRPSAVGVDDPRAGIWVGYPKQKQLLERLISRVRADQVGLTSFVLLYGHWGTGKSHALLWARNWIKETEAGCVYYLPTLKSEKGKLSLSQALKSDVVDRGFLPRDIRKYHSWLEKKVLEVKSATPNISNDDAIKKLYASSELCELARDIYHSEGDEEALRTLLTDGLSSDHEAVSLLSRLVNLFITAVGNPLSERFSQAVYLLVDELDDLSRQPAKDSLQTNDTIRHLFDSCPNCFGLILAASAELNTLQHLFTEYVLSRMTRRIEFEFLDQVLAKEFVRQVLDKSRDQPEDQARSGFFPFEEDAVIAIISHLRQITPRDVVNTMQQVLEEVRLAGIDPSKQKITSDVLDEKDILGFIFDT